MDKSLLAVIKFNLNLTSNLEDIDFSLLEIDNKSSRDIFKVSEIKCNLN